MANESTNVYKITKTVNCPLCDRKTPTPSELEEKARGEMFCACCEGGPFEVTFMKDGTVLNDREFTEFLDSLCET